jgi:transposase-like protein
MPSVGMLLLSFAPVKRDDAMVTTQWTQWESLLTSYPLAKLKCISPRGRKDLAARRGRSRAARWAFNPLAMSAPARYLDLVREMKNAYNHRLRLVESARQRGLKPTARLFTTTVPTVRKWLRRFQQHGPSGLLERSRAPHRQARKLRNRSALPVANVKVATAKV